MSDLITVALSRPAALGLECEDRLQHPPVMPGMSPTAKRRNEKNFFKKL